MEKEEYLHYIKSKYPYLSDIDIEMTYRTAKENLLNALFPFDDSVSEVPERYEMKLLEAMEEIIDTGNMRNFTSYSENGVSWQRDGTGLQCLKNITPYAG